MCDGLMARSTEKYKQLDRVSYLSVFEPLKDLLQQSDYVMGNLETPISFRGEKTTYKSCQFCTDYEFAKAIKAVGIDFVSTANNHCLDRGITGLESTILALDSLGIEHCGTYMQGQKHFPFLKEIGGLKVGVISCTYGTNAAYNGQYLDLKDWNTVDLLQEQEAWLERYVKKWNYPKYHPLGFMKRVYYRFQRKIHPENEGKDWFEKTTVGVLRRYLLRCQVKKLKQLGAEFIVVYAHVGGQNNYEPSIFTKKTIRRLFNFGCNLVIANHEHVIHGMIDDIPQNRFATYAIGNLLGQAGVTERPYDRLSEYSVILHCYVDEVTKKIAKCTFSITKTIQDKNGRMEVWPAYELIRKENENHLLKEEVLKAAYLFSGIKYDRIYEEFTI